MGNTCCGSATNDSADATLRVVGGPCVQRKSVAERIQRSAAACRSEPRKIEFSGADLGKWKYVENKYNGCYSYHSKPELEKVEGLVASGLEVVKANPAEYEGVLYQSSMIDWPEEQQCYTLVKRTGSGFTVRADSGDAFTYVEAKYQALAPDVEVIADQYTDAFSYQGAACGEAVCPGRGHGVADVPMLTIVRDADPSDVAQGGVGDCWLLSAISALAEYDGAIARLFRKNPGLESLPTDEPNKYIVTLWDLSTWSEVDIEIDERLCMKPSGKGLLGCTPSVDGELWVCYLEKAIVAHCGGWDNIDGGTCVHAFRLLLGCKDQYTIRQVDGTWKCLGAFNPNTSEWEELANSPHHGFKGCWPMAWPEVGGGGDLDQHLDDDALFARMCCWEDAEYIMCCGTKSGSDTNDTDGIVDGHAYSIVACKQDVAGSGFNLIKVRNPWGAGEFKSGKWDDDGPGWDEYPAVKKALNPVQANDGVFWLEQEEFFKYFKTVYLCAKDMHEFLE